MTYEQTLAYMYTQLPMYSRTGADAYKKDITNTVILCEHLNNPQKKFKSVHIAGTNGKGSTSHMLAAIFQTAGYKTGLYTSPHLKDFRERIKVNGEMIPGEYVTEFVERVKPLIDKIEPSFFEITVAMAFEFFVKSDVDIAIVEVGLGGRLDSTNIITPEVSVITNIGWDHMNILGNSLEKIAMEKAGIIKPNVPVIIGEEQPDTSQVFRDKAKLENAQITFAGKRKYVSGWTFENHALLAEVAQAHSDEKWHYQLDLTGMYQLRNLLTVLETAAILQRLKWNITEIHIRSALAKVKKLTGLHGRWETIHEHPSVILDVGHNEDGIKAIASQLESTSFRHLFIVIGMVKDKEIAIVLQHLPKSATYFFTRAQIPRALPEEELAEAGKIAGLSGHHYPEVNQALKAAMSHAGKEDLILVCGSVFVVGEVNKNAL